MSEEQRPQRVVVISGTTIIIASITIPVVFVWLILASIIIFSATQDANVLDRIEGLLTALAVLTVPTSMIITELMRHWHQEQAADATKKEGGPDENTS